MPIPLTASAGQNVAWQMTNGDTQRKSGAGQVLLGQSPFSLAVVCDLIEENWPSMDLAGDILLSCLRADDFKGIDATRIRPAMSRRLTAAPFISSRFGFNLDRILNRF